MLYRTAIAALAAVMFTAQMASAQELRPIEGQVVHLGAVSGIVYMEPKGTDDLLVATLGLGENVTTIRFEASLQPGQKAVVSVPRGPGEAAIEVRFHRLGDHVFVDGGAVVTQ